jgi:hypothetical protein
MRPFWIAVFVLLLYLAAGLVTGYMKRFVSL